MNVQSTYRNSFKRAGVEGPVDLRGDVVVVVVEVLQSPAPALQRGHGLVEGQGQGPHGVEGQGGLLEAAGLLGVHPTQTRHQGGDELLRSLNRGAILKKSHSAIVFTAGESSRGPDIAFPPWCLSSLVLSVFSEAPTISGLVLPGFGRAGSFSHSHVFL